MRNALYQVVVAAISMVWGALSRIPKFGALMDLFGRIGTTVIAAGQPVATRGSALVRFVCDGPEGYAVVQVHGGTFLVPASLRTYYETCLELGALAQYEISLETVHGVSVGEDVLDLKVGSIGSFAA